MGTNLRTLGVRGKNLPTKKSLTVQPSDFSIGGIIGHFERKFKKAFLVNNTSEKQEIFGDNISSSWYGSDAVKGYFDNIVGTTGKLYIKSHVGYTGSAYDAVTATSSPVDGTPSATIRLDAGYLENLEFGVSGNRTGYTITNGARFSTTVADTVGIADVNIKCASVIGIKVGDIVRLTKSGPAYGYGKVTVVTESTNTITVAVTPGVTFSAADVLEVLGFQIKTYRKSISGVVTEVDTELGKVWCTTEPEVTDFYVENVFKESKWMIATKLTTASTIDKLMPANVSTVTYLASGADGTAATTSAHWAPDLVAFDNLPVRFLANPETTTASVQIAMETYAKARWDNPIVIYNSTSNRTKAQLQVLGNAFQRSDDVLAVYVADWVQITDPFTNSSIAPLRSIPNVGHVMGLWVRTIGLKGIHYIPTKDMTLFGIQGVNNSNLSTITDQDRTDLAQCGVNVIQYLNGNGYVLRNLFTPSTATEYLFGNGLVMRNFIKISSVDSLQLSENTPNSFARITEDRMAILSFMYDLWFRGSTATVPEGETFGQSFNTDGTATKFADHIEVQADLVNNPQSKINLGERNVWVYFSYPAPAGSIEIGVGVLLRS